MKDPDVTLLFLNAGRRVELIRCFRDALKRLSIQGRLLASDIQNLAPALYEADSRFLLPRSRDPEFIPQLIDLCHKEKVTLVIPLIDPDLPVLARNRAVLDANGIRVLVSEAQAIDICRDKTRTCKFLKAHGFPAPAVFTLEQARTQDYPLFIKPRDGSSAIHTFKVHGPEELEFFARYVPNPIIQEFMDGVEATVDVFLARPGEPLMAIPRRRLKVRSGEVSVGSVERNPDLERLCLDVARALNLVGCVNVQVFVTTQGALVTEINPRFGGGAPLSIHAGAPLTDWTLQMALNRPLSPVPASLADGLTLMRFDDGFYVPKSDLL